MAMAASADAEPPDSTTINFRSVFMHADIIQEILLRFPCSASVACAVFFSWDLRRIVSNEKFLERFRQRHPCSPLLGVFVSSDEDRLPLFVNVSSGPILDRVICRTDTGLTYLDRKKDWILEDCRNGRLLLCSEDDSFCIYDPLSQRRVDCESRSSDLDGKYLNSCLLYGRSRHMVSLQQCGQSTKALESFRVISLQRRRGRKSTVRAVEYDSGTLEWRSHPWKKFKSLDYVGRPMHAAGHIFWACSSALLIVLDTETMKFSQELLPRDMSSTSCAIGELEDGKACAVCLQGFVTQDVYGPYSCIDPQPHLKVRLQVWLIEKKDTQKKKKKEDEEEKGGDEEEKEGEEKEDTQKKKKKEDGEEKRGDEEEKEGDEKEEEGGEKEGEGKNRFDWKMKEEFLVSEILDKDARVYQVTEVVNGLVVICNRYSKAHYVINLHSKTQVAKFKNRGQEMAYLYQLPWPPSVMEHIAGDEVSKQCPGNNKDGQQLQREGITGAGGTWSMTGSRDKA